MTSSINEKTILPRQEAIVTLAEILLPHLSSTEREGILTEWWGQELGEQILSQLPPSLRSEIVGSETYNDPSDSTYNPLIRVAIVDSFYGVKNEFIVGELRRNGVSIKRIIGDPEPMHKCPCCSYLSLKERGRYMICPVCFWEDDGTDDDAKYSMPNRTTLGAAKKTFVTMGISDPKMSARKDERAIQRYDRW